MLWRCWVMARAARFPCPLRTATMRYATRALATEVATMPLPRDPARRNPRRPTAHDRNNVDEYLADHYLQRLIDGAFALLAGDADMQTMQPQHAAATEPIETARAILQSISRNFWRVPMRGTPPLLRNARSLSTPHWCQPRVREIITVTRGVAAVHRGVEGGGAAASGALDGANA